MAFTSSLTNQFCKITSHKTILSHYPSLYWCSPKLPCPHTLQFSTVTQSCPTLWPHGLQHARPPCPLPTAGACSNSYPLNRWCHPTISSSVALFSFCLQSFPASGSFLINQLFTSGGQSIGASVSASVLPMNIQGWFPLELTGCISLQSKGLLKVFSTPQFKNISSSDLSLLYGPTLRSTYDYWKDHSLDYMDLSRQSDVFAFYHMV